jgi:DNA-binding response OmpR family regulator
MAGILVVHPDHSIREALRDMLSEAGHTVAEAPDAASGLHHLHATDSGMIVLLDGGLPRPDICPVLAEIRADPGLCARHAYLLLTTNAGRLSEPTRTALEVLGAPVVAMPFDMDSLLAAVAEAECRLALALPLPQPQAGLTSSVDLWHSW